MNKKMTNNILAICAMVVLSIGIVVGIKFTNGDFGSKEKTAALDVSTFASDDATITEAVSILGSDDAVTGYVVTVSATGFNAAVPIEMKVSFDADKVTMTGFEVVAQEETAGLGANVATEEFTAAFNGVTAPVYTADMAAEGSSFDQISGATLSSKAVATGINAACDFLANVQ